MWRSNISCQHTGEWHTASGSLFASQFSWALTMQSGSLWDCLLLAGSCCTWHWLTRQYRHSFSSHTRYLTGIYSISKPSMASRAATSGDGFGTKHSFHQDDNTDTTYSLHPRLRLSAVHPKCMDGSPKGSDATMTASEVTAARKARQTAGNVFSSFPSLTTKESLIYMSFICMFSLHYKHNTKLP